MATNTNNEDELLDSDISNSGLSLRLSADTKESEHKKSIQDDEALLLSSPSQSPKSLSFDNKLDTNTTVSETSKNPEPTHVISDDDDDDDVMIINDDEFNNINRQPKFHHIVLDDDDEDMDEEDEDDDEEFTTTEESYSEESDSIDYQESDVDGKIKIFYVHGSFFLWNAEDVQMLREECRIIGKLTGCLPRAPRQNNYLGLPLQLMPEEAKLLVDIDAAVLVEEDPVEEDMLKIRGKAFKEVREVNFKIQQKLYQECRQEAVRHRLKDIIAGKKAKKRKLDHASNSHEDISTKNSSDALISASTSSQKQDEHLSSSSLQSKEVVADDEEDKLTVEDIVKSETSAQHALVQIFTENPWTQSVHVYEDWEYPNTERELIRYLVFRDLWRKGFFMTSGSKFGGDFLVYPGDPARYHSHYIAICKDQYDEIPSLEIVSLGRLASNVRKTALLCSVDRNRKVLYTSVKWTGIT
ncbi:tRNA-splicing endonuclease subunit Sen34 [Bulinus truncatus]|nr:tRNA-splicing endonuclease subunit Sen34 [Bulinus truncatus]